MDELDTRTRRIPKESEWTERERDAVQKLQLLRALASAGRQGLYPDGSPPDTKVFRLRTKLKNFLPWLRHYTVQNMAARTFFETDPYIKLDPVVVPEAITKSVILRQGGTIHNGDTVTPVPCLIRYEITRVASELIGLEIQNWVWETWLDFYRLCQHITVTFPHEVSKEQTPPLITSRLQREMPQVEEAVGHDRFSGRRRGSSTVRARMVEISRLRSEDPSITDAELGRILKCTLEQVRYARGKLNQATKPSP